MPLADPAIGNELVNRLPEEGIGEESPRGCIRMRIRKGIRKSPPPAGAVSESRGWVRMMDLVCRQGGEKF